MLPNKVPRLFPDNLKCLSGETGWIEHELRGKCWENRVKESKLRHKAQGKNT